MAGIMAGTRVAADVAVDGAESADGARPLVIELYTSQGCSSCPPADAFLGELAERPDVLALAFHVDYWDGLGWPDRFELPIAAQRQARYVRRLRLPSAYTPQMVVDGRNDVAGFDRRGVSQWLGTPHRGVPVQLSVTAGMLIIRVAAAPGSPVGDVLLLPYLRRADTPIGRGENAGRRLREFNVVRGLYPVGRWHGAAAEWRVSLSALPADAGDVAVLVQEPEAGPMIGAARLDLSGEPRP